MAKHSTLPFMARLLRICLMPLSWCYLAVIQARNLFYEWGVFPTRKMAVPVISVGNLSVGGTGKTPMAIHLLQQLLASGYRPAYLSRGYGRNSKGYVLVEAHQSTAMDVGDEALMVASRLPEVRVAVCENRVMGASKLLENFELDCIVLDDAFQHRRIYRDLDIVMMDANRPPWQDYLLPAGRLREPLSSLKRAQLICLNKVKNKDGLLRYRLILKKPTCFAKLAPTQLVPFQAGAALPAAKLAHRNCISFSGLGNNDDFFETLHGMGMLVNKAYRFADHYQYKPNDIQRVLGAYRRMQQQDICKEPLIIVTTEKDYCRIKNETWFKVMSASYPFYYLEVSLEMIEGQEIFDASLQVLPPLRHAGYSSAAL